ncbi:HPr family phosphocarrier protein [Paenibacillus elgii]|uniref:HPr family phosphocarrier protein n=1 Tax=Paenibacillus elgii TaxID=189691 RepID=UPI00203BF54D|nr:HPr family phosphocarrier protein [Paenibacillus elgii]MCM3272794.1 HPr family phosphocarrier protein [Paenibacillus elgii]
MQLTFRITDENGVHARPATALVKMAKTFENTACFAEAHGKKVKMHSVLALLSLDLESGDTVTLLADGPEEGEALQALKDVIIKEGLGELYE